MSGAAVTQTVMSSTRRSRLITRPTVLVAAGLLTIVAICALAPQLIASLSPATSDPLDCALRAPDGSFQDRLPPSRTHWFGTDIQGCDQFARVVYGARSSLILGLGTGLLSATIGTALGVLAGWRGGVVDSLVRRAADVTLGVPFVLGAILLLSMVAGERRRIGELIVTLALLVWPSTARIARTATRSVRHLEFIEASRAQGASPARLVMTHVVPNVLPTVIAFATPIVGLSIGIEATLSYLGIGLQSPAVSWGLMIDDAQGAYERSPHLLWIPALFVVATVSGFLMLGDALSDALDQRRSHS